MRKCDTLTLVCDYWPAGNIIGKPIYLMPEPEKEPGSKCEKKSKEYEALCDSR